MSGNTAPSGNEAQLGAASSCRSATCSIRLCGETRPTRAHASPSLTFAAPVRRAVDQRPSLGAVSGRRLSRRLALIGREQLRLARHSALHRFACSMFVLILWEGSPALLECTHVQNSRRDAGKLEISAQRQIFGFDGSTARSADSGLSKLPAPRHALSCQFHSALRQRMSVTALAQVPVLLGLPCPISIPS
jgi:hypothetical protein